MEIINNRVTHIAPCTIQTQPHYFPGVYYGSELTADCVTTSTALAGSLMSMTYFTTSLQFSIDRIGVQNTTATANPNKVIIYRDDYENTGNYLPSILEFESTPIVFPGTGFEEVVVDFTFYPGIVYWIGVINGGQTVLRRIGNAAGPTLGTSTSGGATDGSLLYSHTYANPLPTTLNQSLITYTSTNAPWVKFRAV